jgi:hypothetical protein
MAFYRNLHARLLTGFLCVCANAGLANAQTTPVDSMDCQQVKVLLGNVQQFSALSLEQQEKVYLRYNRCLAAFEKTVQASDKPLECTIVRELFENPQRLSAAEQRIVSDEKLRCDAPELVRKVNKCIAEIAIKYSADAFKKGAGTRCCQITFIKYEDLMRAKEFRGKWAQCLDHYKVGRNELGNLCRRLFILPNFIEANAIQIAERGVAEGDVMVRNSQREVGISDAELARCTML